MEEIKCIYCGKGEKDGIKLSESDIIPESLIRKRLVNKHVCREEHNNKFSNKFEAAVINELGQLRNHLGIKNKGHILPAYSTEYLLEDIKVKAKITRKEDLFRRGKILNGRMPNGEKVLLGRVEDLKGKNLDPGKIRIIESDKISVLKEIPLKLELFYSIEMLRLAAKVGYEWYCKKNKINGFHENCKDIVEFIVTGKRNANIVSIITYKELYEQLNLHTEFGSYNLIIYKDPDENSYVLFSFLGLIIYKIKICSHNLLVEGVQSIKSYFVRTDGSDGYLELVANVSRSFYGIIPRDAVRNMSKRIIQNYQSIYDTQLLTLRNYSFTINEIEKVLQYTSEKEIVFESLLSSCEEKKLSILFILQHLGEKTGQYDFEDTFNNNLLKLLETDIVKINIEDLFNELTQDLQYGNLVTHVLKGIEVCKKCKEWNFD